MTASKTGYAQLRIEFIGRVSVGMVSLMPENVWGASEEKGSATAHTNFLGNPNYRLRRDMVEAMKTCIRHSCVFQEDVFQRGHIYGIMYMTGRIQWVLLNTAKRITMSGVI